jgi:hypothetical protein
MLIRGLYEPMLRRWMPFYQLHRQLLVVESNQLFERPVETMSKVGLRCFDLPTKKFCSFSHYHVDNKVFKSLYS